MTIGRITHGGGILCLGDEAVVILPPFNFPAILLNLLSWTPFTYPSGRATYCW
uniref:Uncharacterized protein n=1 Tax=Helianthus annuus TaxID=4232 RepID=A0A251RYW7_HELAN